jgi:PTH1 family peptidyl-tRNA hydrolase
VAWLVAGLGNPGDRYANTRHNLGRMVVDELASEAGERFRKVRFMPSELAEVREGDERVLLVRSTLYMNESGPSFAGIAKKQGIDPDHVIAVHDEIEIAPGELRIKFGGGTAGHNGLRSLGSALRTPDFYRVRAGVGRPPGRRDPSDYVLAPIAKRDGTDIAILVGRSADAVRSLIRDGLTATQDRFNRNAGTP